MVKCSNVWWEIFWVYSNILFSWHLSFQEQFFLSHVINLAPRCASEIVLLKTSFDYKRDATGDDASSGYYNLSPPAVNLNLGGSDLSGQYSHTNFAYVTMKHLGNCQFLINSMVFAAFNLFPIPAESLQRLFTTAFHHVSLLPSINKVSIVSLLPWLL